MNSSNNEMNSTTSSVKSFKCNCCDYTTNRNQNLLRHKQTHLKKGGDDVSVLSDDEDHTASVSVVVSNTNKECRMCINYKQLIEMKDSRIYELENQIELLQKDMRIAVLETKLENKDAVVDMSGNFIGLQQQTIENVIQMQQPQPKGRPTATKKAEEAKESVLQFPAPAPKPAPKVAPKRKMTKDDYKMQDLADTYKLLNPKLVVSEPIPTPAPAPPPTPVTTSETQVLDSLNQTFSHAEPFINLIECVFENERYFEKSDLTEDQLKKCGMPKNDYHVSYLSRFQDHYLTPSKSKKALFAMQPDLQGKERFFNFLLLEAFNEQEPKSFYYDKKTKQSFYKDIDTWKVCDSNVIEKIVKRLEDRLTKVAIYGCNMLKQGIIPSTRYGYENINYTILNSGRPHSEMPKNEQDMLEQLSTEYITGLFESCDNERQSDILFKEIKKIYDPKAQHISSVNIKYDKIKEVCEADEAKEGDNDSDKE